MINWKENLIKPGNIRSINNYYVEIGWGKRSLPILIAETKRDILANQSKPRYTHRINRSMETNNTLARIEFLRGSSRNESRRCIGHFIYIYMYNGQKMKLDHDWSSGQILSENTSERVCVPTVRFV